MFNASRSVHLLYSYRGPASELERSDYNRETHFLYAGYHPAMQRSNWCPTHTVVRGHIDDGESEEVYRSRYVALMESRWRDRSHVLVEDIKNYGMTTFTDFEMEYRGRLLPDTTELLVEWLILKLAENKIFGIMYCGRAMLDN